MTFAPYRLQTRHIYLAYMVAVRLNSSIAQYEVSAADFVTKPPSGANMERGEGMDAGAGFLVHPGAGSLRYSVLLGATHEAARSSARQRPAPAF